MPSKADRLRRKIGYISSWRIGTEITGSRSFTRRASRRAGAFRGSTTKLNPSSLKSSKLLRVSCAQPPVICRPHSTPSPAAFAASTAACSVSLFPLLQAKISPSAPALIAASALPASVPLHSTNSAAARGLTVGVLLPTKPIPLPLRALRACPNNSDNLPMLANSPYTCSGRSLLFFRTARLDVLCARPNSVPHYTTILCSGSRVCVVGWIWMLSACFCSNYAVNSAVKMRRFLGL